VRQLDTFKARLSDMGFALIGNEPLKLTISAREVGYTGDGLAFEIAKRGGICEFSDPDFTVMMLTPELGEDGLQRIESILSDIKVCDPLKKEKLELPRPKSIISPQKALFSEIEEISVDDCEGRIQAEASVSCPPAVPIVVCGEEIDKASVNMLKYYGIKKCRVVKK
jgi:arginine/lysine/ornithine decarboxylase